MEDLKIFSTRLPVSLYEKIKERAQRDGMKIEGLVRRAFEAYLDNEPRKHEGKPYE